MGLHGDWMEWDSNDVTQIENKYIKSQSNQIENKSNPVKNGESNQVGNGDLNTVGNGEHRKTGNADDIDYVR